MVRGNLTFADYNGEISTVRLGLRPVFGSFFEWRDDVHNLMGTISNVSLGLLAKREIVADSERFAGQTATAEDENAQRETKWLVRCFDNVNSRSFSFEIPAADLSLLQPNSELMDVSGVTPGAFLVGAIQAGSGVFRSPWGNPATVIEIRHVGRNI